MAQTGILSILKIANQEYTIKDEYLTNVVDQIIDAITDNNREIGERINDLDKRAFDALIKISSQNESEIASIENGMYKIQYVTSTGDNETINNSAILIQTGNNQYLYKDGKLSSRTKTNNTWSTWITFEGGVTSVNGMTGAVTITHPVTSVNGQTGAVTVNVPVTSVNGMTGAVTVNVPVTSVNGMTGAVTIVDKLSTGYEASSLSNEDLAPTGNDTFEIAIGKLHKAILDNEEITAQAYADIDERIDELADVASSGDYNDLINTPSIPEYISDLENDEGFINASSLKTVGGTSIVGTGNISFPVTSVNGKTGAVTVNVPVTSVNGKTGAVTINVPVTSVNGQTGAVTITIPEGQLSNNYATATGTNSELLLEVGDTYEKAFSKLEKEILDNELIAAAGMNDLNEQIANITHPVTSVNGQTGAVTGLAPLVSPGFSGTPTAPTPTAGTNNTQIATTAFVQTAVSQFGNAMEFKGSVGTGGTYTSSNFPASSADNKGWTVKVITDGTYQGVTAKEGDTLISDGTAWVLIPSGDEPNGTVMSVDLSMPTGFEVSNSPITSSGTLAVSMKTGYMIPTTTQVTQWTNKVTSVNGKTGAVTINIPVTSVNGQTGTVVITHPVTSVNGQTGAVVTTLSDEYEPSSENNDDLLLEAGDTYEEAFGKLEKEILNNSEITAAAIQQIAYAQANSVTSVNGETGDIEIPIYEEKILTAVHDDYNPGIYSFYINGENPNNNQEVLDLLVQNKAVIINDTCYYLLDIQEDNFNNAQIYYVGTINHDNTELNIIGFKYLLSSNSFYYSQYKTINLGGSVTSVNGMTGVISLTAEDVKAEPDYSKQYLTFEALQDTTFTFTRNSLQYSLDNGTTWTSLAANTVSPTVTAGNKILWKQTGLTPVSQQGIGTFSSTGNFNVYGNIMSLYYGDNFIVETNLTNKESAFYELFSACNKLISCKNLILPATTLTNYCYSRIFYNCTSLTTAPALPATTLVTQCYQSMFRGCTSLTTAPALPATTLANNCYREMFSGCTSLTIAPELPVTTLAQSCYSYMFSGCTSLITTPTLPATTLIGYCYQAMFQNCTSLTTAPELPATTVGYSSYDRMFSGCTSLNYIKCLATDISATNCTNNWVQNVSSTGTFVKADNMSSWTIGNNGIPTSWTAYTESEYEVVRHYELANLSSGVTSVNGMTGIVTIADKLSTGYSASVLTNDALNPTGNDTFEIAISKLHKSIIDNEEVTSGALADLDERIDNLATVATSGNYNDLINKPIITHPVTSVNGMTGAITLSQVNADWNSATGTSYILNKPAIKTNDSTSYISYNYNDSSFATTFIRIDSAYIAAKTSARNELRLGNAEFYLYFDNGTYGTSYLKTSPNELTFSSSIDTSYMKFISGGAGGFNIYSTYNGYNLSIYNNWTNHANGSVPRLIASSYNTTNNTQNVETFAFISDITSYALITSVNGQTGTVTITHPVTSVNGQTGAVTLSLGDTNVIETIVFNGVTGTVTNKTVTLAQTQANWIDNDTTSSGFIKNKPQITTATSGVGVYSTYINKSSGAYHTYIQGATSYLYTSAIYFGTGISYLSNNSYIGNTKSNSTKVATIGDIPVTSVNGMTGAVTVDVPVTSVNGMTGAVSLTAEDFGLDHDYSKDYLTFTARQNNTNFTFSDNNLKYSIDNGATWSTLNAGTTSPSINTNQTILWKQSHINLNPGLGIGTFSSNSKQFDISGNIMSLFYEDNFVNKSFNSGAYMTFRELFASSLVVNAKNLILPNTVYDSCYDGMFRDCTALTIAPDLPATTLVSSCYIYMFSGCSSLTTAPKLPATTLASWCYQQMFEGTSLTTAPELPATTLADSCYSSMFFGCTSLTTAPELPATILANGCYQDMFSNCTSLTTAPELPATTLASYCYFNMFAYCYALTIAPELPATTLVDNCYYNMFFSCENLKYIKCSATNISASDCTGTWVSYVSATGTFIKADNMDSWTIGNNGIPTNWNVYTESEYEVVRHYELSNISSGVTSVNGQTGTVTVNIPNNLHITLTSTTANNTTTYTANYTYNEIIAAISSGGNVDVTYDGYVYDFDGEDSGDVYFARVASQVVSNSASSDNVYEHTFMLSSPNNNDVWTLSSSALITNATTAKTGVVKLNNTTSSTSTAEAATAKAVKTAYDHGGVQSVNGQTGAVTITYPVTSVNNQTGTVTINVGVTSFNGNTGNVSQVKADWNETNSSSYAYIQNKPAITTGVDGTYINVGNSSEVILGGTSTRIITQSAYLPVNSYINNGSNSYAIVTKNDLAGYIKNVYLNNTNTILNPGSAYLNIYVNNELVTVSGGNAYINIPVTSVNGKTGAVTVNDGVTSFNGVTGNVSQVKANWTETDSTSYAYIQNKPTIPTVNNSTVTITMNGNTVGTFTLNKSGNTTIDLGTVLTAHQSIKTINSQTITGTGNVSLDTLPPVTSSDNGKVLMVVNGAWELVSPVTLYSGATEPNNAQGNNGDIYVQS